MCTASRIDRMSRQRLRGEGMTAPPPPGSFGQDPWVLRPKRLQWLGMALHSIAKNLAPAQIAASLPVASAHHTTHHLSTAARAGAMAGASPPFTLPHRCRDGPY